MYIRELFFIFKLFFSFYWLLEVIVGYVVLCSFRVDGLRIKWN